MGRGRAPKNGTPHQIGGVVVAPFEQAMETLGGSARTADVFFKLGLMYSTGSAVAADFVAAHKWFNLAALKGCPDAGRLRRELAEQMSEDDIAAAQRAARDWLKH